MKIITRLFFPTSYICAMIWCLSMHSSEQNTLTNALGDLSAQLRQFSCKTQPFLEQLNQPQSICILDQKINQDAPSLKQLENFAKETCIEVVQLVVAWQDLSVETFLSEKSNFMNSALEKLLGYSKGTILSCMLKNPNNHALKKTINSFNKPFSPDFLEASLGGGYASCGYHTILHLKTLNEAFMQNTRAKRSKKLAALTDLIQVNDEFGLDVVIKNINNTFNATNKLPLLQQRKRGQPKPWRTYIMQERIGKTHYANPEGEWLQSAAMGALATLYFPETQGTFSTTFHTEPATMGFMTIPPSTHVNVQENYEGFFKASGQTAASYAVMVNIRNSHWYGIFVTFNTTPALCIIVDSKNFPRYNETPLQEILKGFFPASASIIQNSINANFKSTTLSLEDQDKKESQIFRLQSLQNISSSKDFDLIKDALRNSPSFSDQEMEYIFTHFALLEPLKKDFNFFQFKQTLKNMRTTTVTLTDEQRALFMLLY